MSAIAVLVVLTVLATFAVLIAGGVSMARGGKFDVLHSFPLMEARVVLQAIAVMMVLIALLFW